MVQTRMRVQKCLVLFYKMQSLNFTVTKLVLHADYLHYSGVALFLIFIAFTRFLKWLFYVYSLTASVAQMEKYGNPLVAKIISVNPTQP